MAKAKKKVAPEVRILVLQRGWVYVGYYARVGEDVRLTKAQCIRRWGTTRGLGELAASGPLENTKLDPAGDVEAHLLTVVHTLACDAEKWRAALG